VTVTWKRGLPEEGGGLELVWSESGGPTVTAPDERGFGTLMIERNLARSLDAHVDLTFAPDGVRCRIVIPASHLSLGR
jgi:two-component sensor histidine kinase